MFSLTKDSWCSFLYSVYSGILFSLTYMKKINRDEIRKEESILIVFSYNCGCPSINGIYGIMSFPREEYVHM